MDDQLRRAARLMPPDLLMEALEFARGLYSSFGAHAIAALVPFLPAELRAAACEEALMTGSARFENAGDMHKLIVNLAPYLPPQVMWRAVSAALGIDEDETVWRREALLSLAPRLNEAERRTVFSDAEMDAFHRRERSAELRTRVEHASLATADEREMLLNAVVSEEEDQRVPLLVPLIPLLTGEARTRAVACALSAARSLKYNSAPALAALVEVLPQEPARETAEEAIAAAIAGVPGTRFEALLTAAPALRTADRKRALEGAFDDAFATLRQPIIMGGRLEGFRRQLPSAASGLPPGIRAALVLHGVRELDQLARADVLRAIAAFMPTLLAAEAAPAVADVIAEVESWWP